MAVSGSSRLAPPRPCATGSKSSLNQPTNGLHRGLRWIGLTNEDAVIRQLVSAGATHTRCYHEGNMRPSRVNNAGQLEPVHAPWHIDVREQCLHVMALFEELQGRRRSNRLNHLKASLFQNVSRASEPAAHPQQEAQRIGPYRLQHPR